MMFLMRIITNMNYEVDGGGDEDDNGDDNNNRIWGKHYRFFDRED